MARRRKKLPAEPQQAAIESLTHDGRGVTHVAGKVVFVAGALPGEEVMFRYTGRHGSYDEGDVLEVLQASPQRITPRCAHFGICGGCSLQHLSPADQIAAKQARLLDNLSRMGQVAPDEVLPPLTAEAWGYRRKARLGVRYMPREQVVRVGFRERNSRFLADLKRCDVLHPAVGERIGALAELVNRLSIRDQIPQIEVAVGDDNVALVFRHLAELSGADKDALCAFGREHEMVIFLQPGGPRTVQRLWPPQAEPEAVKLSYRLPAYDVELCFEPTDFTQVNQPLNRLMIDRALALLDPQPEERILDLFCGLGNFSLPLARRAGHVVGVEGEAGLVERARENARRNGQDNVEFHVADLTADLAAEPWYGAGFDKLLLDPPRSGAAVVVENLPAPLPRRIVYVSCDPATLARDAGTLVKGLGYRLVSAGVMDMFPHTAHVESIALFVRD
jgi:23S rRNA (uracil1939-C5)-methyltransferase